MAINPECCEECEAAYDALQDEEPDTDAVVEQMLAAVRKAAEEDRLTKVGHWQNMRVHLDGRPADSLVEFAACVLFMRGELYGHETPYGVYLRRIL